MRIDISPPSESTPNDPMPRAFQEDSLIRHAYVEVFLAASFHGATHTQCVETLKGHHARFLYMQQQGLQIEGLETMARTLRTVERRLGVDPDRWIIYDFVCPDCWYRYDADVLYQLVDNTCTHDECGAIIFEIKTLSDGRKTKRIPLKIMPRISVVEIVQQILLRPGKYEEFQHWRTPDDEPGPVAPMAPPPTGYDAFPSPNFREFDIYDGWGWRAIQAGLERHRTGRWGVQDVDVHNVHSRFVSLPCGLVFILTVDWYVCS